MLPKSRSLEVLVAVGCTLLVLLISSVLPIWKAKFVGRWESSVVSGQTLWTVVANVRRNEEMLQEPDSFVETWHKENLILGGCILLLSVGVGGLVFWAIRRYSASKRAGKASVAFWGFVVVGPRR